MTREKQSKPPVEPSQDVQGDAAEAKPAREPNVRQAEPTKPRPQDENGYVLDSWGLPVSGPARARKLAELGREDPEINPAGWPKAGGVQE